MPTSEDFDARHVPDNRGHAYTPYMHRIPLRDFLEFLPEDHRKGIGREIFGKHFAGDPEAGLEKLLVMPPFQHPIRDTHRDQRQGKIEVHDKPTPHVAWFWAGECVWTSDIVKPSFIFEPDDSRAKFEEKVFGFYFMAGIKKRGSGQFALQPDPDGLFQDELLALNPSTGQYARDEISAMWIGWQLHGAASEPRKQAPSSPSLEPSGDQTTER